MRRDQVIEPPAARGGGRAAAPGLVACSGLPRAGRAARELRMRHGRAPLSPPPLPSPACAGERPAPATCAATLSRPLRSAAAPPSLPPGPVPAAKPLAARAAGATGAGHMYLCGLRHGAALLPPGGRPVGDGISDSLSPHTGRRAVLNIGDYLGSPPSAEYGLRLRVPARPGPGCVVDAY